MTPDFALVIVNYNGGAELARALQSVAHDAGAHTWEGLVVDNASTDGSADVAEAFAPRVMLVRNQQNVGFGRAVNQAIARTSAPFVLVMNPDCWVRPGAIETLMGELVRDAACAVVGPRILDPDGAEQGSARGDPDMLTGLFGRTAPLRRWWPGLSVSRRNVVAAPPASGESVVVDWVSGACFMARRQAIEAVRGFDERYFLYWEDADLCRRLRAAGHRVRYVPAATAVHQVGRSSGTVRAAAIRAFHESAYLYYATHVAPGRLSPRRVLARLLLRARCRWQLMTAAR